MNKQNAKHALFTSVISLLLCVSMLIGTTFAWFTDSVTSANNLIQSGNLDVELEYWNGTQWVDVSGKSDILTNTLWEPGVTEIAYLRLANAGSLALKYQLGINIVSETEGKTKDNADIKLSDYLEFGVVTGVNGQTNAYSKDAAGRAEAISDIENAAKLNAGYTKAHELYPANNIPADVQGAASEQYLALVVYMPTSVGNEANHNGTNVPEINLGIELFATQFEYENDSFGNTYDKDAVATITSPSVAVPEAGESAEDQTISTNTENNVTMTLTGGLLEDLAQEADAPSSVSISHSDPKIDANNNTVKFDHIELIDQDGNIIDLEAMGNDQPITVKFSVGDAFNVGDTVIVYHDNELVATPVVDNDKNITYTVTHFCAVSVGYNDGRIDTAREFLTTVNAAEDGDVITLAGNIVFNKDAYSDNGGWNDGLYYNGDKSFTIDLNGYTITNDSFINDYLLNFRNAGEKANEITIKNGTLDATSSAYCALCTSSTSTQKTTINLENVKLFNNISNGSTAKIRGGAELNVKDGTVITGKNSYLGIECINAVVNIYDGAEIYMNGTGSYNGCLAGVGYGGTINVYGGYGKGVKGGFIAMTSGGTINVSGGEWIANTDGSIGNNSNLYVLTAQSNIYENGFAGPAVINVSGGTFRGGMDAWVLNNHPSEKAELNITGGNFNADPTRYLADDRKEVTRNTDGTFTVDTIKSVQIGDEKYETLEAAAAAAKAGDEIKLLRDVTLSAELTLPAGITLNGNGKQINGTIYAGGNLTFAGHTKVTSFSASYYDRVITIGEGACLEITGGGRVSLAYGNTFNITGSITDAKTADKANIQPSLIIPAGISITGGSDATMNVTNAYVQIGSTTTKNSAANGKFVLNFNNAIAEFTKELAFAEPTSGKNPTVELNVKDSVLTTGTKLINAVPNSNVVIDNSVVTLGTNFRNSGELSLVNGSVLTGATIQFGENGGNNGTTTVDNSTMTITATSAGHALDGKDTGKIVLRNGAEVTVTYYKDIVVDADSTSTFTGTEVQ